MVAEKVESPLDAPDEGFVGVRAQLEPDKVFVQAAHGPAQPPARWGEDEDVVHVPDVVLQAAATQGGIERLQVERADQLAQGAATGNSAPGIHVHAARPSCTTRWHFKLSVVFTLQRRG